MFRKFFGDRAFYKTVLAISVPIMIQNGITNFVSLLDNIMVGRLSTEAMSGVSIVNQFIFIFNLLIFGAISAAGIFTAQYHGHGDIEGVRATFRMKMLICISAGVLGIAAFALFGTNFINLFLHDGSVEGDLAQTLGFGLDYLHVMLIGLMPYALTQVYASTLRETGETVVPMTASIAAVATNFVLNYILIFGKFGAPALGVTGAAIATVVSRFVELAILVIWTGVHSDKCAFIVGAFRSLRVPAKLAGDIALKGLPLMANEFFWSLAVTLRNQCYSTRGLDCVAAQNISSTITNLFNVVYLSLGTAVAIIIGNLLGAGKLEEAKDQDRKLIAFSVMSGLATGLLLAGCAKFFPMIYNTSDSVRSIASSMILISAAATPFWALTNAAYFTIRSGGKVLVTVLFDSGFMWAIVMPLSYLITYCTPLGVLWLFAITQATEGIKGLIGIILVKKGTWLHQLVGKEEI